MSWTPVSYLYDGTYAGFLTCVYESYAHREEPAEFTPFELACASLYPQRAVETDLPRARRVYRGLEQFGPQGRRWAVRGFLSCLPERELWLWRFYRLGFQEKGAVSRDLTHPVVDTVARAVRHLEQEAHLLTGFVRFSELEGVLVGEIAPKNRVLPLLCPHFCGRYPQEPFLLYDRTHQEALVHGPGKWAILPMEEFQAASPGAEELQYRRMWRKFYDTIAIQARYNPKCRMTHMPKRYWGTMTEFQEKPPSPLPRGRYDAGAAP